MTNEEIRERCMAIISDALRIDNVSLTDRFQEDLSADSLDALELALEFENWLGEIYEEDFYNITTVGDAIDLAKRLYSERYAVPGTAA